MQGQSIAKMRLSTPQYHDESSGCSRLCRDVELLLSAGAPVRGHRWQLHKQEGAGKEYAVIQEVHKRLRLGWDHAPAAALPFRTVRRAASRPCENSDEPPRGSVDVPGQRTEYVLLSEDSFPVYSE